MELPSVPDNSISPTVQTSLTVPERDSDNTRSATPAGSPTRTKSPERFLHTPQSSISSLVRRAKEADRQARTPVRPPRTPVRRSRNHSESGDSRSRSPLSRSSSVQSAARDESPLNFNAALDMDSKRAFSEDEDAEGDGKKISAAQYDTFRQAVTSSRGTFKINPAKTKRAARASLLDLGETEVPDRVSWLDQPSKSFPPRMSVPNFSEKSWSSYKRLRFLRCLRGLQRRPTYSCCAVTPFSGTSISSPQFSLPCVQGRLKVIMWLVLNQRYFKRGSEPSDKLIVWQAHQWLSPDRKKSRPVRRRHPGRRRLGLLCLTGWALLHPQRRGRSHRSRPFQLAPEGPVHDPSKEARSLASLLMLPQPRNVDGFQVGARLADFAPHWRSLLGNCRATGIVEDGVGIAFQQRPQLTHQSISFRTRNSRQDLQQAIDALLMKGTIERVTNLRSLGFYSRLFLVPKKTGDLRPVIDLSTLNRHMVVPHFKIETQGSVRSAIRSQEWAVSIDIRDAYLHVPMHQAVRKYLRFVVNKKVYQFTCLPFGLATSPREFTKLLRPVVSLLRQQGVKLQVYLDDWLIRADTPEEAQLHSQTIIKVLQFLGWIINFEKSDLTPSQDFQFIGMQFNTQRFTVAPLPKCE